MLILRYLWNYFLALIRAQPRSMQMPGPSPQVISISNPGPNGYRVTGGNTTSPLIIPASTSASPSVVYGTPLVIELMDGDGLAGGPGEEGG